MGDTTNIGVSTLRKLLQETTATTTTASTSASKDDSGGLSVAWIAAIVINAVLVVLLILVVTYCYCRNKKQRRLSRTSSLDKNFRGNSGIMYVEKANHHMKGSEKAALIRSDTVYTVEGDRGKQKRHPDDNYDLSKDRCTCNSPQCYCSVGDEVLGPTSPRRLEHKFEEEEEEEVSEPYLMTPEPEPRFHTPEIPHTHFEEPEPEEPEPEPEDDWRPESEKEEREETYIPGAITPEPEYPVEKRYLVYKVTDNDGSREIIGQLNITDDVSLTQLRRLLKRDNQISSVIDKKKYHFLDEHMKTISNFRENSLSAEKVFQSEAINIQFEKVPRITRRPALPAYVGPLGMCSRQDCGNPSRIKCLDCGTTSYCSTKCMRLDKPAHQKECYKPPWRV